MKKNMIETTEAFSYWGQLADRGDTNPYHEALLMWSFQKDADSFQADFLSSRPEDIPFSATLFQR